jgi:NAD(P)-dependent dehydrogenase (short-subunit alcohol dehydrogenase family)
MQSAAADFMQRFGTPDIVIAAAGISVGTLTEFADDLTVFKAVMDINVLGMVTTFQPFIVAMRKQGSGVLAGIGSVAGIRGLPGGSAYSASKAAAITYLESLRVELKGSGVAVTTVNPGYIVTPMTAVNPYPGRWRWSPNYCACYPARCTTGCFSTHRTSRAICRYKCPVRIGYIINAVNAANNYLTSRASGMESQPMSIAIILIDDHPLTRLGTARTLEKTPGHQIHAGLAGRPSQHRRYRVARPHPAGRRWLESGGGTQKTRYPFHHAHHGGRGF